MDKIVGVGRKSASRETKPNSAAESDHYRPHTPNLATSEVMFARSWAKCRSAFNSPKPNKERCSSEPLWTTGIIVMIYFYRKCWDVVATAKPWEILLEGWSCSKLDDNEFLKNKKNWEKKKLLHTGAVSPRSVSHNKHSSTATDLAGISMWRSPDWALIF